MPNHKTVVYSQGAFKVMSYQMFAKEVTKYCTIKGKQVH